MIFSQTAKINITLKQTTMLLIIYNTSNTQNFNDETFANLSDLEIASQIKTLDKDEYCVYDLSGGQTKTINSLHDYVIDYNNEMGLLVDTHNTFCESVNLTEEEWLNIQPKEMELELTFSVKTTIKGKNLKEIVEKWQQTEIKEMEPEFVDYDNFYVEDVNGKELTKDFMTFV